MREEEIQQLIKLLRENEDIGEIEIESSLFGSRKIRVSKYGAGMKMATTAQVPAETPVREAETADEHSGKHAITAPMVGTFYRAPNPDSGPFVEEGDRVSPGKVICIIEAMKLMNEIEADCSGVIREIASADGQPVEFGQALFYIEKS